MLVHPYDIVKLFRKISYKLRGKEKTIVAFSKRKRVIQAWSGIRNEKVYWYELPEIKASWNQKITGQPAGDIRRYILDTYVKKSTLKALSLACGTGSKEIEWALTGNFDVIDAFDLSEARILEAKKQATKKQVATILNFFQKDISTLNFPKESYDFIIADSALHHFNNVETVIQNLYTWLKPNGLLFFMDYVGPPRFQWTKKQLRLVNHLLVLLPMTYRSRQNSASIKKRYFKPGLWSMYLNDPSEAVESHKTVKAVQQRFQIMQETPLGGTLLHLLLDEIAYHFTSKETQAKSFLNLFIDLEQQLIEAKEIPSDFVFLLARNPPHKP